MKKSIAILLSILLLLPMIVFLAFAADSPQRNVSEYLTIHYDFEGNDISSQFADKATAGSSNDKLAFDGTTADALNYYSITNGVITATAAYDVVPVAVANTEDLLASNVGNGTWFIRCKAAAATPLIDFRHCAQQSTLNRVFYLALNDAGNIVVEAKSGATGASHVQAAVTYFTYDYGSAPWLNLAAVRKLVDGKYWYYLYVSTGDAPLEPLTTNGSWQVRLDFGATETSGLTSAENINMGLFNQAFTTWKTTPGVSIDDVRYYNTDLTTEELSTVVGSIVGTSDPVTPPADTDEPSTSDTSEPSDSTEDSSKEPPSMETVDPDSGGTPTLPELPTDSSEDDVQSAPVSEDDMDASADDASTDANGGCGSALSGSALILLLLIGMAVLPVLKHQKSMNRQSSVLDQ